jgi:hypothetical protein
MGKENTGECGSAGEERIPAEPVSDTLDFTPERWKWLKERSLELEKDYVPTRTLIEGL